MFSGGLISILVVVIVLVTTVPMVIFAIKMFSGLAHQAQEEQRLLTTGQPATGQILGLGQTGTYINNQPQVNIVLQVFPPGGQPYQTQITKILSMIEIPQYQPGAQVQVRYDPQNPMKVAIAGAMVNMMAPPGYPQQFPPRY